jgi:hypothetical protein
MQNLLFKALDMIRRNLFRKTEQMVPVLAQVVCVVYSVSSSLAWFSDIIGKSGTLRACEFSLANYKKNLVCCGESFIQKDEISHGRQTLRLPATASRFAVN